MKITCPECGKEIPIADVNPSTDVALCRGCGKTFSFAGLAQEEETPDFDFSKPPRGAWVRQLGGGFEVGSSARSGVAIFLIPFTAVWSGGSLGGIYGKQIARGHFDWKMSLFGIPFLIGSAFLIPIALVTAFGKVVVRGEGDQGSVRIGVGPIGWTRRFRWSEIKGVHRSMTKWQQDGRNLPLIELQRDGKPIRFGSQLSDERSAFVFAALKRLHAARR